MSNTPTVEVERRSNGKARLKLLMLTTFFPPYNFGGDGIYIYRLCNQLAQDGHQVDVLHCVDAYEVLEKSGPKGNYPYHENMTVYPYRSGKGVLSPLLTQQTSRSFFKREKIQALIEENSYDVIHYHNMSLIGLEALGFGDNVQTVKFYHTHEHWLICPMHVLWKYNREPCEKRECVRCQLHGKRPLQMWRYSNYREQQLAHIDRFLSPSKFTLGKHRDWAGLDIPILHLPYFLPTAGNDDLPVDGRQFEHDRPYFLFVGRLEKIKGVQNLIRIFDKFPQADLLVAGDGEYMETLQTQAADVSNVKFLGRIPYEKLRALYKNAQAVLVSSICYEVFGIIIIEAYAQRTPVITNNLGALPEVVEDSGGGYVYNNEAELIAHMEKFLADPTLRSKLGDLGYDTYRRLWSEDYHMRRYYGLIQEVAAEKGINRPAITALAAAGAESRPQ